MFKTPGSLSSFGAISKQTDENISGWLSSGSQQGQRRCCLLITVTCRIKSIPSSVTDTHEPSEGQAGRETNSYWNRQTPVIPACHPHCQAFGQSKKSEIVLFNSYLGFMKVKLYICTVFIVCLYRLGFWAVFFSLRVLKLLTVPYSPLFSLFSLLRFKAVEYLLQCCVPIL